MNNFNKLPSTLTLPLITLAITALAGCSSSGSSSSSPSSSSAPSGTSNLGDITQSSDLIQQSDDGYSYPTVEEISRGGNAVEFSLPSNRLAINEAGEVIDFSTPDESDTRLTLVGDGHSVIVSRNGEETTFTQDPDNDYLFRGPGNAEIEVAPLAFDQTSLIPGEFNYSLYGFWSNGVDQGSDFYFGFETHPNDMPAAGSASYSGGMQGVGVDANGVLFDLVGSASMNVDFTAGTLAGAFTNVGSGDGFGGAFDNRGNWNDVEFSGDINANQFSGTTSVTSPGTDGTAMGSGASGTVQGHFFGPQAAEAAGLWNLDDGSSRAQGVFGSIRD